MVYVVTQLRGSARAELQLSPPRIMHFSIGSTETELCKTDKQQIEIGRDIKRILRKLANELCNLLGLHYIIARIFR